MQITRSNTSQTEVLLNISVEPETIASSRQVAVEKLSKNLKVPGFREGKAPASMVEKAIDPSLLAEETINHALNLAYSQALVKEKLHPVAPPKVEVTKFVPFTTLEFKATIEVVGVYKLADYKKLKAKRSSAPLEKDRIKEVLENLRTQMATKKDVDRPAKLGDQVWIDFDGTDAKGKPVQGAKGNNYPIILGSNTFIPGFEDYLIGLKAPSEKKFTITFPKDYGVKALQSKKVTFQVTVIKVQQVEKPKVNEEFVKKVSPTLKTVTDLEADIKRQLEVEASNNAQRAYENAIVAEIVEKSEIHVPQVLIDEQVENVMQDLQQNITYRGMTYEDYLQNIGMTAEEQREKEMVPEAIRRLKAGIILSEIAEKENMTVTPEELEMRVQVLINRHQSDPEMLKQIKNPASRREIGAQLLTEKIIAKIVSHNN